jgi:hypothetical protein
VAAHHGSGASNATRHFGGTSAAGAGQGGQAGVGGQGPSSHGVGYRRQRDERIRWMNIGGTSIGTGRCDCRHWRAPLGTSGTASQPQRDTGYSRWNGRGRSGNCWVTTGGTTSAAVEQRRPALGPAPRRVAPRALLVPSWDPLNSTARSRPWGHRNTAQRGGSQQQRGCQCRVTAFPDRAITRGFCAHSHCAGAVVGSLFGSLRGLPTMCEYATLTLMAHRSMRVGWCFCFDAHRNHHPITVRTLAVAPNGSGTPAPTQLHARCRKR